MTRRSASQPAPALVPLDERWRGLGLLRLLLAVAAVLLAGPLEAQRVLPVSVVVLTAAGYLGLVAAAEVLRRAIERPALPLFNALLLLDGLLLAVMALASGGPASPVRALVLIHVTAVCLLASYRTGAKLAVWHSLLAVIGYEARATGLLGALPAGAQPEQWRALLAFVATIWLLALVTATCSAVNERELRRGRADLEQLAALGRELESARTPAEVCRLLVERVAAATGFRRVVLVSVDQAGAAWLAAGPVGAGRDAPDAEPGELAEPVPAGRLLEAVLASRRTLLVDRLRLGAEPVLNGVLSRARNVVATPLVADARVTAVLVAESGAEGPRIPRRLVTVVERMCAHAALALRNAHLLEDLRERAATDGLTGVANRRSFDEALDAAVAHARRTSGQLSVLLVDVDGFKALNDAHGHAEGDEVLRRIAATLRAGARPYDTVARFGGEEFAVLLPDCTGPVAATVAERLRAAIEASPGTPVTVSIGVACLPRDGNGPLELVTAADERLYAAKRAGRNRVVVPEGIAAAPAP